MSKRLKLHNINKGAKFTRGSDWTLLFKKKYSSKSEAMKNEYILKKNLKHLHNLAKALLEFETLSGDDVKELISKGKIKSSNKDSDDTSSNKKTSIPLGKGKEKKRRNIGLNPNPVTT